MAAISLPRIHPPKSSAIGFSSARAAKQQQREEKGNWKGRWDEVHGEEWTTTAVVGKWTTVEWNEKGQGNGLCARE